MIYLDKLFVWFLVGVTFVCGVALTIRAVVLLELPVLILGLSNLGACIHLWWELRRAANQ